jgi:hypothetical protein
MEQRRYHSALTPEALGDMLVQHFNQERRTEAQRLGTADSVLVQVRHGHEEHQRIALTIGIARQGGAGSSGGAPGITHSAGDEPARPSGSAPTPELVVTVGEQQWFGPQLLGGAALGSLIGALFTPWALFGLIWPISRVVRDYFLPNELWTTIDNYVLVQGGTLVGTAELRHPHDAGGR